MYPGVKCGSGFTLLEMSIVIVIIALLVAGIVGGRTLIRAAELRGVISELDGYTKAVKTFQDKYLALPGDMSTAESYWGADTACPNTAANNVRKTETCNGDGNGQIALWNTSTDAQSQWYETFRAWQHLSNAGLTEGKFTGAEAPGIADLGASLPASKFPGGGWNQMYMNGCTACAADFFPGNYGHGFILGGPESTAEGYIAPALTPSEALEIDTKVDDGLPAYGAVLSFTSTNWDDCATTNVAATAVYETSVTDRTCTLIFLRGF